MRRTAGCGNARKGDRDGGSGGVKWVGCGDAGKGEGDGGR